MTVYVFVNIYERLNAFSKPRLYVNDDRINENFLFISIISSNEKYQLYSQNTRRYQKILMLLFTDTS